MPLVAETLLWEEEEEEEELRIDSEAPAP